MHSFILSLFYVSSKGLVNFYWQESLSIESLAVYAMSALLSVGVFYVVTKVRNLRNNIDIKLSDKFWLACSVLTVLLIFLLMF